MVTARLAIGSVSTLAFGALLLGSAPYLLNKAGGSHAAPWGSVSGLGVGQSAAAQSDDDRAQLLKLAALKSGTSADAASPATPAVPVAQAEVAPAPIPAEPVAAPAAQSVAADAPAAPPPEAAAPADAPQQVASLEAPTPATEDAGGSKADRVNINTASLSALDHLPGTGRIGHTIVTHRPYKNVKDLVSRRILRTSDFQKIQAHISVD